MRTIRFPKLGDMRSIVAVLIWIGLSAPLVSGSEVSEMETAIFSLKRPPPMRELLEKLRLVKEWTKEGQDRILLDKDGSLGQVDYTFEAEGFGEVEKVTLSWGGNGEPPAQLRELVNLIVIEDKRYFHVYHWNGKQFVKTNTKRLLKEGEVNN